MISKNKIRLIHSLAIKKNRQAEQLFVAEGPKTITDIIPHTECVLLAATDEWLSKNRDIASSVTEVYEVTSEELRQSSLQQHPQDAIAVFKQFSRKPYTPQLNDLTLALDGIQDPGNMGTIIRIADWFGIEHIICNNNTVDIYNPKVVQATMGSIARVSVEYVNLLDYIVNLPQDFPIYGTLLDGKNIYKQELTTGGLIIMGNEASGISLPIRDKITSSIKLPNFPEDRPTADSLNVAVATAVTCAEFRRNTLLRKQQ